MSLLFPNAGGETFTEGIVFMIRGALRAVLGLSGGYLLSEIFIVLEKVAGSDRIAAPSRAAGKAMETVP
jgi:hypothetical protein